MVAVGAEAFSAGVLSLYSRRNNSPASVKIRPVPKPNSCALASAVSTERQSSNDEGAPTVVSSEKRLPWPLESKEGGLTWKDYFEQWAELTSRSDRGPPRWFSPLIGCPPAKDSPVLLSLPGVDGVGLGLLLHHERLAKIFDIWCMHIPLADRTSFTDLVKLIEGTVRQEHSRNPNRPIYLVGESFGGCLALAVAALNPDVDLILILANPATSFSKSQIHLQTLLSTIMPDQLLFGLPYFLTLLSGAPIKLVAASASKGFPFEQVVRNLTQETMSLLSNLSAMSDSLNPETIRWKLDILKSGASFANSRLHAVKAQTLILASGQDELLPSKEEAERLRGLLPKCEIRVFDGKGHAIFLEKGVNLVSILTATSYYRRGKRHNYVSDYVPPSPCEFEQLYQSHRWIEEAMSPVMLSTLESGEIVRSLCGVPGEAEGPVLYVGYHMMLGLELIPLVSRFLREKNILLRGMAHPMIFTKARDGNLPALSSYDVFRTMGAVPVSAANFYRLFSSNSHILLYPGGMREALHRKGEEYKLFWPEQSEFVRMAAKFGAKIVPFGCVGEDDIAHLVADYDDLRRIPYLKHAIEDLTDEAVKLRSECVGEEVGNQDVHLPILVPKVPGRFYYLFGKPIETQGRQEELKSREKGDVLYSQVKSEVENCLCYLKGKREEDPYRNIFARLTYQATHGFRSHLPTFPIY